MCTETQQRTEHASTTDTEIALPDYARAVACCGDPRAAVEELSRVLDEQVPPRITSPSDEGAENGDSNGGDSGDRDA